MNEFYPFALFDDVGFLRAALFCVSFVFVFSGYIAMAAEWLAGKLETRAERIEQRRLDGYKRRIELMRQAAILSEERTSRLEHGNEWLLNQADESTRRRFAELFHDLRDKNGRYRKRTEREQKDFEFYFKQHEPTPPGWREHESRIR